MQARTNLINPLHHVHLKNFREYVKGTGGSFCVGVKDGDGKFYCIGDREMMTGQLQEVANHDRGTSREWIPADRTLPRLSMPLCELLLAENTNKLKQSASAYVHHFLKDDQQIGKVYIKLVWALVK